MPAQAHVTRSRHPELTAFLDREVVNGRPACRLPHDPRDRKSFTSSHLREDAPLPSAVLTEAGGAPNAPGSASEQFVPARRPEDRAALSELEFDALRQRQLAGPIERIGLPAHVGLPRVAARFAPAAGIFLAAERAADFGAAGADIDIGDAAIAAAMAEEGLG